MQLVEFDTDRGKIWINPEQIVKVVTYPDNPGLTTVFVAHEIKSEPIVVRCAAKKAVEEINRCLK